MKKYILLLVLAPLVTLGQSSFAEIQSGTQQIPISALGSFVSQPSKDRIVLSAFGFANMDYVRLTASPSMSVINLKTNLSMYIGAGAGVHIIKGNDNFHPHVEFVTAGTKSRGCLKQDHDINWDVRVSMGLDGHFWHLIYINYQATPWLKIGMYSQTKFLTGPRMEVSYKFISAWGGAGINPESPWNPPIGFGVRLTPGIYKHNRRITLID